MSSQRLEAGVGTFFDPRGKLVASALADHQSIGLYDIASGKVTKTIHSGAASSNMVFSPDGRRLAVATKELGVQVWDAGTGSKLFTLPGHAGGTECMAFGSDSRRLATGGNDGLIRVWDADPGGQRVVFERPYGRRYPASIAFSPRGQRLAAAGLDAAVMLWDLETGQEIIELACPRPVARGLTFSPDGQRLAAIVSDGSIVIWDAGQ